MKYIHEFRQANDVQRLINIIQSEVKAKQSYRFMEFCGGHTHSIFRYGINKLLPLNIKMIHGPGCPVCVLPMEKIDIGVYLIQNYDLILCAYGDMLRVPGSNGVSLLKAKAQTKSNGSHGNVKMVYSALDALDLAISMPHKEIVFFAIGFETTTPATAVAIQKAKQLKLSNFSVFCNHVLTPPAIRYILESPDIRDYGIIRIDGFIGPGQVSTVIGCKPYHYFASEFQKPVVIAGFEPIDLLQAILMLVRQVNIKQAKVENQYFRAVRAEGNVKAQRVVSQVLELKTESNWRGLGRVPYSALRIRDDYTSFDSEKRFSIPEISPKENKQCQCGAILRGSKTPLDCKIFGRLCTPENPIGSCMVSGEGACSAYYNYSVR